MPTFTRPSPAAAQRPSSLAARQQRETLEEHEAAQATIEFAAMRRQADTVLADALRQSQEADDKTADAVFASAVGAVGKIQSGNIRVQNAFSAHTESMLAGWQERYAQQRTGIRRQNLLDASEGEYEAALREGDVDTARATLMVQSKAFPEREEANRIRFRETAGESALYRVRDALAEGRLDDASLAGEGARSLTLTLEQKEHLAKLEDTIGRGRAEARVQGQGELLAQATAARNLPAAARRAACDELRAMVPALGFSPGDARATYNFIDNIEKGEPVEPESAALIEADRIIRGLTSNSSVEEMNAATAAMYDIAPYLGDKFDEWVIQLKDRLDELESGAIAAAVDMAYGDGLIEESYKPNLRRALERRVNAAKGTMSPSDILALGAELAAMPNPAGEPEQLPPAGWTRVMGWLDSGVMRIGAYGIPEPLETNTARVAVLEIWNDPRMTQTHADALEQQLKEKYPKAEALPTVSDRRYAPPRTAPPSPVGLRRNLMGVPVVQPVTEEEYNALPSGTTYPHPDGTYKVKP